MMIPRFSKEMAHNLLSFIAEDSVDEVIGSIEAQMDVETVEHYRSQPTLFLEGCLSTLLMVQGAIKEAAKQKRKGSPVDPKTVLDNMRACALVLAKNMVDRDV
jgi:hypothetical protein